MKSSLIPPKLIVAGVYRRIAFVAFLLLAFVHTYTILTSDVFYDDGDVAMISGFKGNCINKTRRRRRRGGRRFIDRKPIMDDGCTAQGNTVAIDEQNKATFQLLNDSGRKGIGDISTRARKQVNLDSAKTRNRNVVLVHVGKAGGMTIRYSLATECQRNDTSNQGKQQTRKCQSVYNSGQKLGLLTRNVFHMWDKNETAMEEATTFVITLRNPIDRVISSYRYSHPENCIVSNDPMVRIPPSRGCITIKNHLLERKNQIGYILFKDCYPSAGIEDFAQSTMIPWREPIASTVTTTTNLPAIFHNLTNSSIMIPWMTRSSNDGQTSFQNLTDSEKSLCRRMARRLVQGHKMQRIVPHMQLNYEYYARESLWKYPGKEVFAIRTEHAWDDMVQIDQLMDGSGNFQRQQGKQYSHGSEYYQPCPISAEAYHKLCCVLENEIDIYLQLFDRAINLDANSKKAAEDDLREKCGLTTKTTTTSWTQWRIKCQERIAASQLAENVLRPHSVVSNLAEAVVYHDDNNNTATSLGG